MKELNSIIIKRNYGKIRLKLDKVMDEQNISRNKLAKAVNTRYEVINKWYQNQIESLDLDVLARICFALGCQLDDILEYVIDENEEEQE